MARKFPGAFALCLLLGSCIFSTRPFETRPGQLHPETDAFREDSERAYLWTDGWSWNGRDTSLAAREFRARDEGDTVVGGVTVRKVRLEALDGNPLPVSAATSMGFNPSRLRLDSAAVPEPGPPLDFPAIPEIGWRRESVSGDFRFTREITGLDTLDWRGRDAEAWVLAETTYWNGAAVSMAVYALGRAGLLRYRSESPGFNAGGDTAAGILWQEVRAK